MVRYFNPDTFEILESDLPEKLVNISEELYGEDFEFVSNCYDESGYLKTELGEKSKHILRLIFKDVAYRLFMEHQKKEDGQTAKY